MLGLKHCFPPTPLFDNSGSYISFVWVRAPVCLPVLRVRPVSARTQRIDAKVKIPNASYAKAIWKCSSRA